ncbi:MAG: metallophosphoesterase [Chlorobiaceae bacterium]|nr:metallophosphoesterase [Chlorobiaceae bacterium]NTV16889.1 metallophosphoesterase [Chlorobiaceae bacterium]
MITEIVKIAHISDLHILGKLDRRQLGDLDRLLAHFNTAGFDHLVISGDISNSADPGDWRILRDKLESHGLFHWDKTTVIAGNHDLINLEEEMRFYNALNPLPMVRKKAFQRKLSAFCTFFHELITGDEQGNNAFPFVKIIKYPSVNIAFVALNTVHPWYPADNPLGARGFISSGQLRALSLESVLSSLRECFVIGLCHHAFKVYGTDSLIDQAFDWTMELKNREELLALMKTMHAKLVLHGHFHRFQSYTVDGITFINGGSFRYDPKRYSRMEIKESGSWTQNFFVIP